MVADAVFDGTSDHQLVAFHHVPRRVFRIFRHENDRVFTTVQALADGLGIDRGNHNVAVARVQAPVDNHQKACLPSERLYQAVRLNARFCKVKNPKTANFASF